MPTISIALPNEGDFLEVGELVYLQGDTAVARYDLSAPGCKLMAESLDDRRSRQFRFQAEFPDGRTLDFSGQVFSRKRSTVSGKIESKILSDDPIA